MSSIGTDSVTLEMLRQSNTSTDLWRYLVCRLSTTSLKGIQHITSAPTTRETTQLQLQAHVLQNLKVVPGVAGA